MSSRHCPPEGQWLYAVCWCRGTLLCGLLDPFDHLIVITSINLENHHPEPRVIGVEPPTELSTLS